MNNHICITPYYPYIQVDKDNLQTPDYLSFVILLFKYLPIKIIVDSCRLCMMMSSQYPSKSSMPHRLIISGYINRTVTIIRKTAKIMENSILLIMLFKLFIRLNLPLYNIKTIRLGWSVQSQKNLLKKLQKRICPRFLNKSLWLLLFLFNDFFDYSRSFFFW